MSVLARRSKLLMWFDGVNISDDIAPYFLTATYTDNDDGVSDDLQVTLQDRDKIWMKSWLNEMVNAAAEDALKIRAKIWINYWNGYDVEEFLDCGEFELDSVSLSGPPNTVTIKACSLPFTNQIRQTKKSKAWENYSLSAILAEIAGANGMGYFFDTPNDPFYDRVEQSKISDIAFLQRLCTNAGLNIKATKGKLVIYDQSDYEQRPVVIEADYRDTSFTKWKLNTKTADTKYASCRVSYVEPATGACIEYTAYTEDYDEDAKTNQQLELYAKVGSVAEAKTMAEKHLRLHNKFSKTVQFTHTGHVWYVAGVGIPCQRLRLLEWTLYLHTGKAHNQQKRLYNNCYRPQDTGGILMADEVTRLRIGTVSAVDKANLAARVIFKDENIVSGWLPVLQRTGEIVTVATAGKHDHDVDGDCTVKNTTKTPTTWTDSEGKVHTSYETAHSHGAKVNYWLPKVNETVACLYLPTFNGDGVILGAIKT